MLAGGVPDPSKSPAGLSQLLVQQLVVLAELLLGTTSLHESMHASPTVPAMVSLQPSRSPLLLPCSTSPAGEGLAASASDAGVPSTASTLQLPELPSGNTPSKHSGRAWLAGAPDACGVLPLLQTELGVPCKKPAPCLK